LVQIADGRTTIEKVRTSNAASVRKYVASSKPALAHAGLEPKSSTSRAVTISEGLEELVMREPLKWYDADATDKPPWIKALVEVRHLATREGWCYPHVQAITAAIDQYAESTLGNRDFFLNRPHSIGGNRIRSQTDIP
jgi:hypothetical protein